MTDPHGYLKASPNGNHMVDARSGSDNTCPDCYGSGNVKLSWEEFYAAGDFKPDDASFMEAYKEWEKANGVFPCNRCKGTGISR
jgi:hypothetical protein